MDMVLKGSRLLAGHDLPNFTFKNTYLKSPTLCVKSSTRGYVLTWKFFAGHVCLVT